MSIQGYEEIKHLLLYNIYAIKYHFEPIKSFKTYAQKIVIWVGVEALFKTSDDNLHAKPFK